MRAWLVVCVAALSLSPGVAGAVSEDTADAGVVVQEKVDRESRGVSMEESLRLETVRRAEAAKRVEKIRNLPPERVQDWISGKITEADLDRVTSEPRPQESVVTVAVPRDRLNRLLLACVAFLVLAFLYGRQRRLERLPTPKSAKR